MNKVATSLGVVSEEFFASSSTIDGGVAIAYGATPKARAGVGGAIVIIIKDADGKLIRIRSSMVGDNGVKPDTFYRLSDAGEFDEVLD